MDVAKGLQPGSKSKHPGRERATGSQRLLLSDQPIPWDLRCEVWDLLAESTQDKASSCYSIVSCMLAHVPKTETMALLCVPAWKTSLEPAGRV